jgi:hypothetical protein
LRWPADLVRAVTKDSRIALRLSSDQGALIRLADEGEGASITDFAVAPTGAPARHVPPTVGCFRSMMQRD